MEKNLIAVTEVSEDGSVPQLRVVNFSETPVLIVDGEELVGAKQNRAVNTTILIAAGAETVIPVSCVEQGRWTYKTREFKSEGRVMSSKIRASKADQVRCSLRDSGRFASDQGAIWGEIQDLVQGFDVESPSTAMADVYRKERPALAEYTRELSPIDQQVGGVFVINGRVAGVETFGKPETFTKLFRKLVESYALEAINTGAEDFTASPVSHERVLCFLGGILGCDFRKPPIGWAGDRCPPGIDSHNRIRPGARGAVPPPVGIQQLEILTERSVSRTINGGKAKHRQ